ncbi:MAG: SpoIIE family protein phosphatase [Planctomycetota bacterium]
MADDFPLNLGALLSVLNRLNIGVYITDLDRCILLWNRKAEEITGYRAKDVIGKPCHDQLLMHTDKDDRPLCSTGLCPLFRAMMLNRESDEPVIVFAKRADGARIAVSVTVGPLHDEAGNVIGGIETFRDESQRIHDLELAGRIQRDLLPRSLPQPAGMRLDVRYYPCDLIGGDFYDVRPLGPGRYGVLVADVSGHGVAAALYTMWLRSLAGVLGAVADRPAQFLGAINRELSGVTLAESFATAFYAVVDVERREVTYCNAGHPPPVHFRAGGAQAGDLDTGGMLLGVVETGSYEAAAVSLEPGDLILCYTDGMTEVIDQQGEMLGQAGLASLVQREMARPEGRLLERLYLHTRDICGDVALVDDILLLSIAAEQS